MKETDSFDRGFDLLDRLLGLAPLPQPDPWFAARTLARCRSGRHAETPARRWSAFLPRWAFPALAAVCVSAVGFQQAHRIHTLQSHQQHQVQEAFEVVASMDDDSDSSTPDTSL